MASPQVQEPAESVMSHLQTIANRGYSRFDIFRDLLDLLLAAAQNQEERREEILEEYQRDLDDDRDPENKTEVLFGKAIAELMNGMEATNKDVLGAVYELWGMQSDHFGQHFTPHSTCHSKAEMLATADDSTDPPISIQDPACGSARLLISAAQVIDEPTFCVGVDKDPVCAKMAALNCYFFNMDAVVIQGDSLSVELDRAWRTINTPVGGHIEEIDPDDVTHLVAQQSKEDPSKEHASDPTDDEPGTHTKEEASESPPAASRDNANVTQADIGSWQD